MPQPAHFQQVIQRVIERASSQRLSAGDLAEKICEGLDLAEAIMGDGPAASHNQAPPPNFSLSRPTPSPGMIIAATPAYREPDLSQGLLIGENNSSRSGQTSLSETLSFSEKFSGAIMPGAIITEEAPPSAIVRNPDMPASMDTPEEIESKKAALHGLILRSLPASLVLEIPGLGFPVRLERFVKPGPAGMNFIRVSYSQHQSEEDGPQMQFNTVDAFPGADAVKAEILVQAGAKYRASKPTLVPRVPQSAGFPDIEKMQFARNNANGTDDNVPMEDIAEWNRLNALPSRI